jgi:hypothetical protein
MSKIPEPLQLSITREILVTVGEKGKYHQILSLIKSAGMVLRMILRSSQGDQFSM